MAKSVTSKEGKRKVATVMGEFGKGKLKSSSGGKVTDRKQALAIALSEGREADKPKGALHGAVVSRRRSPAQFPVLPAPSTRTVPALPSQASPTAVAAVNKPKPKKKFRLSKRLLRAAKKVPLSKLGAIAPVVPSPRPLRAEEGAVVIPPLSANLPHDLPPSEESAPVDTHARDLIREGLGELIKEGLWPASG